MNLCNQFQVEFWITRNITHSTDGHGGCRSSLLMLGWRYYVKYKLVYLLQNDLIQHIILNMWYKQEKANMHPPEPFPFDNIKVHCFWSLCNLSRRIKMELLLILTNMIRHGLVTFGEYTYSILITHSRSLNSCLRWSNTSWAIYG